MHWDNVCFRIKPGQIVVLLFVQGLFLKQTLWTSCKCFWPLTSLHNHVIMQGDNFIKVNFCVGCMISQQNCLFHGQRTSRESFLSKIQKFWAWADKLGWNCMRHLGYFWPNYKHYIDTVSPLSIGKSSWISFVQKTRLWLSVLTFTMSLNNK